MLDIHADRHRATERVHQMCGDCWHLLRGGDVPVAAIVGPSACCYCGAEHRLVVLVEDDPTTVHGGTP